METASQDGSRPEPPNGKCFRNTKEEGRIPGKKTPSFGRLERRLNRQATARESNEVYERKEVNGRRGR